MKRLLSLILSFAACCSGLVALSAAPARAQEVAAAVSIDTLRQQYEQLLAIDRDPSTPPEVRRLNHAFLEERRAHLREALKARIEAVRKYRSFAAATLTGDEKGVLEQSVRDLERQLRALGAEPRKEPRAAPRAPAAPQPPARRGSRAARNSRGVLVEASAARSEPEPTPEPDGDQEPGAGGKDEDEDGEKKSEEKKPPIVVTSPAEGKDASKGIDVATREVELKIDVDKTIDQLQVTVFSGDEKKPKRSAKRVSLKPSDQGKASVVLKLAEGKNTITVDDVARMSEAGVEAKRIITYKPPADEQVVGGSGGGSQNGDATTPKQIKMSVDTSDKWTNVPEEGENVRVGFAGEGGKSYQFYLKKRSGGSQEVEGSMTPNVSGVVSAAFSELAAGDIVGVAESKDGEETKRYEIPVASFYDETKGGPFGLMVGGVVLSQQAQEFQQSDPFFGFTVGYMSKLRNAYKTAKGTCGTNTRVADGFRWRRVYVAENGSLVDDAGQAVRCVENKFVHVKDSETGRNVVSRSKPRRNTGLNGWRWNLRFQGIFQSDPRTATTTDTTTADGGGTGGGTTDEPFTFIASRKTFDLNAQLWADFWANSAFSIGPYASVGFSTALDKNELQGEAITDGEDGDAGEGGEGGTTVATQSASDNDVKRYYEGGVLMNIMLNRDLFAQAILAYRRDEALAGLHPDRSGCFDCNTENRFAGKLRVFPFGLNRGFGRQIKMAPMFGVEVNAGRGPDHIKFFSGFAIRVRGINISDATSSAAAEPPANEGAKPAAGTEAAPDKDENP